jgi:hypothetical protein
MRVLRRLYPPVGFVAQSTTHNPLVFEAQNQEIIVVILFVKSPTTTADFEAQTGKPECVVLRLNHRNCSH